MLKNKCNAMLFGCLVSTICITMPIFGDTLPEEVRHALERQARSMNMAHLEYEERKTGNVPDFFVFPFKYSEFFSEGRFLQRKQEVLQESPGEQEIIMHECAFDGEVFYSGEINQSKDDIPDTLFLYSTSDLNDPDRDSKELISFPYLFAAGFYTPSTMGQLASYPEVNSLILHYLRESKKTHVEQTTDGVIVSVLVPDPVLSIHSMKDIDREREILEGGINSQEHIERELQHLVRLQVGVPQRKIVFTLNRDHGYAVTQRTEWTEAGEKIADIHTDKWNYHKSGDIWLPGRLIVTYYTSPFSVETFTSSPYIVETIDLKDVKFGVSDITEFALKYDKPGTLIMDRTHPDAGAYSDYQITHTVSAQVSDLREIINGIWSPMTRSIILFSVIIIGIVAGVVWMRRGRHQR